MPWIEGVPVDHGADGDRPQGCPFVVLHRTVGTWPGDYSVGKNRMHSSPGTFNLLVGEGEGQWVQFYPPDCRCSHAAGGNDGCGIEFSGQNGAPLTDWQVRAGGHMIRSLASMFGVPLSMHDEPRRQIDDSGYRGFVTHRGIATQPQWQHYDYVTFDEFNRMASGGAGPSPKRKAIDEMILEAASGAKKGRFFLCLGKAVTEIDAKQVMQSASTGTPLTKMDTTQIDNVLQQYAK